MHLQHPLSRPATYQPDVEWRTLAAVESASSNQREQFAPMHAAAAQLAAAAYTNQPPPAASVAFPSFAPAFHPAWANAMLPNGVPAIEWPTSPWLMPPSSYLMYGPSAMPADMSNFPGGVQPRQPPPQAQQQHWPAHPHPPTSVTRAQAADSSRKRSHVDLSVSAPDRSSAFKVIRRSEEAALSPRAALQRLHSFLHLPIDLVLHTADDFLTDADAAALGRTSWSGVLALKEYGIKKRVTLEVAISQVRFELARRKLEEAGVAVSTTPLSPWMRAISSEIGFDLGELRARYSFGVPRPRSVRLSSSDCAYPTEEQFLAAIRLVPKSVTQMVISSCLLITEVGGRQYDIRPLCRHWPAQLTSISFGCLDRDGLINSEVSVRLPPLNTWRFPPGLTELFLPTSGQHLMYDPSVDSPATPIPWPTTLTRLDFDPALEAGHQVPTWRALQPERISKLRAMPLPATLLYAPGSEENKQAKRRIEGPCI